ncbi:calcium-binding protein [Acuticoccus sp. I52.16.1]|uniref:calcium-binding protein n=1 Tax=Acuticoccus sp. I52.16.1 TaxID=2928472 RepID=UPI001FD4D12E|nr:calcium-binding protein [Acuticoccus sp. I52.16.1]UOM33500.1 hypothetical protein MRB58_16825 [Acuticoccus sp. I52.16.1]
MADKFFRGTDRNDRIIGEDTDDFIRGFAGNDTLEGRGGNDELIGDEGNDSLIGDTGDDTMRGGDGNDEMEWNNGDGNDLMDGGDGRDTAEVNGAEDAGDAFEVRSIPRGAFFERTNLGPFDIVIENTEFLEVNGLGGNDTIDASALQPGELRLQAFGGDGNDLLIGSDGADRFVGGDGIDVVRAGLGNDLMIWNDGDDSDRLNGGRGFDIAVVNGSDRNDSFEVSSVGDVVFVERNALRRFGQEDATINIVNTDRLILNGLDGKDTLDASGLQASLIEVEANGGDGNDLLIGSEGDDTLVGDRGNDVMRGGDGDDTMIWNNGDGSDLMNGGYGEDTAVANGANNDGDVFVIRGAGENVDFQRTNFGRFSLDIRNTEILEVNGLGGDDTVNASDLGAGLIALRASGGDGDDFLIGSEGDDTLIGDRGDDTMRGGDGDDTMVWNNGDGSDTMNGGAGDDTAEVNGSNDAGDVFEVRSNGDNVLFERTNFGPFSLDIRETETLDLNGLGGDDTIDASGLDNGAAVVDASGGEGDDVLTGSAGDDTLSGDAGDDTLVGFRGDDTMEGGAGDDLMVWNNGDGSDVMDGGEGIDTAQVNGSGNAGDEFVVRTNGENVFFERVNFGNFSLDIRNTEILELNGGGGDDTMDARDLEAGRVALTQSGGEGDDQLIGSQGDDLIQGDAGNDTLVGFRGSDTMEGGDGDDLMVWNNGDGSDTMDGGAGDDTAQVNGADGAGDAFEVVSVGGEVTFNRTNLVPFSIEIDNTETIELNGLGGDDTIDARDLGATDPAFRGAGGAGDDQIFGGNGDDTIDGGAGNDTLFGNDGADIFVFAEGADEITDFQDGIDLIDAAGFEDALIAQVGDDVVIDFGLGNTLTLKDQLVDDIGAGDFLV